MKVALIWCFISASFSCSSSLQPGRYLNFDNKNLGLADAPPCLGQNPKYFQKTVLRASVSVTDLREKNDEIG